jgi:Flp pilus assembly pilin Flp
MIDRLSMLVGRALAFRLEDLKGDEGQTTVEYAVVLVLVILMAIAAFSALSGGVSSFMGDVGQKISDAALTVAP